MAKTRLPPTLRKIGFEIPSPKLSERPSASHQAEAFARHPVVLILVSFLLTGLLGTWLADRYQQHQRDQDAIKKSMDEVRLSIDITNRAFNEFVETAFDLEQDLTAGSSEKRIEQDRINFRDARHKMQSTLTFETARINQQMPHSAGGAFALVTSSMLVGTGTIADCLTLGTVVESPGHGPYSKRVACNNIDSEFTVRYADERIFRVDACIRQFYDDFRPSPLYDFLPDFQLERLNGAVRKAGEVCNNETMLGIKPAHTKN